MLEKKEKRLIEVMPISLLAQHEPTRMGQMYNNFSGLTLYIDWGYKVGEEIWI